MLSRAAKSTQKCFACRTVTLRIRNEPDRMALPTSESLTQIRVTASGAWSGSFFPERYERVDDFPAASTKPFARDKAKFADQLSATNAPLPLEARSAAVATLGLLRLSWRGALHNGDELTSRWNSNYDHIVHRCRERHSGSDWSSPKFARTSRARPFRVQCSAPKKTDTYGSRHDSSQPPTVLHGLTT